MDDRVPDSFWRVLARAKAILHREFDQTAVDELEDAAKQLDAILSSIE